MAQQPPPDITYSALYVLFDVAQNAINFQALLDHLKTTPKKEIEFVNALDFIDQKPGKNIQSFDDMFASVVRNMRTKLDTDMTKALEAKKKFHAAYEKQKQTIAQAQAKGKRPPKINDLLEPEEPKYDGKADILYVIYNIGFSPKQVQVLRDGGFPFVGFLAITPENPENKPYIKPKSDEANPTPPPTTTTSSKTPSPYLVMPGIELSFINNPDCYPPARWDALRPVCEDILFREIRVGSDFDNAIRMIETEVVRMVNANESYKYFSEKKSFKDIKVIDSSVDISIFDNYVYQHPRDYVNGIWMQLKAGDFNVMEPTPPEEASDAYAKLFEKEEILTSRKVVYQGQNDTDESQFSYPFIPQVYFYLYNLINWKPKEELSASCEAILKFIINPNNFHAYAGAKFDLLVQSMNKKFSLGLPNAIYDFSLWKLSSMHANAAQVLAEAIHDSSAIDTIFDDDCGILWMMVMKPVPKVMGQFVSQYSMPQTLQNMSEWMTHIYDHRNDDDVKIKLVNPAIVAKGGLSPSQLLRPLKQRIEETDHFFKMPIETADEAHFTTPYFMENGIQTKIERDVVNGRLTFQYSLFLGNILEINSSIDSLVFNPVESIRLHSSATKFGITIFFNDQMIFYDGENIILKSCGSENRMLVTLTGSLISMKKTPIIVEPTGAISRKVNEKWEYVDIKGETYIDWHKVERKHSQTKDLATGTVTVIRPDDVEYYVLKDGTRKIIYNNEFTIMQTKKSIVFDIPTYPLIQASNGKITMKIDRFDLAFKGKEFFFKCNDYTINVKENQSKVDILKSQLCLTPQRCEVRYNNDVFVADADGTEKIGTLLEEDAMKKKKMDVIQTSFGMVLPAKETLTEPALLNFHTKFPARFFAVRSDFSVVEFLRPETLNQSLTEKKINTVHPATGQDVPILTRHGKDTVPALYIENDALTKPARSALLKEIKIPKGTKNKPIVGTQSSVDSCRDYFELESLFMTLLNQKLDMQENEYFRENMPKHKPPPEKMHIPPQTPSPRVQLMQYDLYQPKLGEPQKMYWDCHESDYGYPLHERRVAQKPLLPRNRLLDPPKFFKEDNKANSPPSIQGGNDDAKSEGASSFITEPTVPMKTRDYPDEDTRPKVVRAQPEIMDFGDVKVGEEKEQSITLANIGTRPIHFALSQIPNEFFKVVSIPGVVFPGLKITIKVLMLKVPKPQQIETSFNFTSANYNMAIPIVANIVKP